VARLRAKQAIGTRFDEFGLGAKVWNVPAERMKAEKEHRVPLVPRAVAMIKELAETRRNECVFSGLSVANRLPAWRC
jgi:integrase